MNRLDRIEIGIGKMEGFWSKLGRVGFGFLGGIKEGEGEDMVGREFILLGFSSARKQERV